MKIKSNGLSVVDSNIYNLISLIKNLNIIDVLKHNFFLGLNVWRNYDIIVANAWQISKAVWLNRNRSKKIAYIIQDEEELFYPGDNELQQLVRETYKNEFHYYCLSKYLYTTFTNLNFNCTFSILGVNTNIYKNMNFNKNNSVVIAYYTYKPGRLPLLIESLIDIISRKYICYIYPCNYMKTVNDKIRNIGSLTDHQLNILYNKSTIGIVMSNTNPSRLGYEMLASGLKVVEYDSKFTRYDMPDKYFTKIKNSQNIMNLIDTLMNSSYEYPKEYIESISIGKENNICLQFFNELLTKPL